MENKTFYFGRENKCFQITCYFKDYKSCTSNSHFYRHYKPFKRNTKNFLWKCKFPKIKQETLCKNYVGGLKSIDIFSKIVSLQCSWIQKLYDKNFHKWKIIALNYLIRNYEKNSFFILTY